MIVRILKPWKMRKVGTVLNDMPDGTANLLIQRGIVERVQEQNKDKRSVRRASASA